MEPLNAPHKYGVACCIGVNATMALGRRTPLHHSSPDKNNIIRWFIFNVGVTSGFYAKTAVPADPSSERNIVFPLATNAALCCQSVYADCSVDLMIDWLLFPRTSDRATAPTTLEVCRISLSRRLRELSFVLLIPHPDHRLCIYPAPAYLSRKDKII